MKLICPHCKTEIELNIFKPVSRVKCQECSCYCFLDEHRRLRPFKVLYAICLVALLMWSVSLFHILGAIYAGVILISVYVAKLVYNIFAVRCYNKFGE